MTTYGSVCSGIEAATVAWHPLGWKALWFAEIEPFPSAVLAHHYRDVPNLGDMTAIARRVLSGEVHAPDILVGGTPCQAFSVAGMRESLADARGNLTLRFVELVNAIDFVRRRAGRPPVVVLWENVPGVLSTRDNAFGCFLGGLAGEDDALVAAGPKWSNAGCVYGPARAIAWRTLDAQYFGLAQRRRRVFVVSSAREGFDPAQVLFEWDGMRRDSAPRRTPGQSAAAALAASAGHHGYSSPRGDGSDNLVADVSPTLPSRSKAGGGMGTDFDCDGGLIPEVSLCLNAGAMGRIDSESETMIPVAFAIQAGALRTNPSSGPDGIGVQADHAYTIEARAEVQAVAFDTTQITSDANRSQPKPGDACHPLAAHAHAPAVAFDCKASGLVGFGVGEITSTMRAMGHSASHQNGGGHLAAMAFGGVRRLTPTECERLQGFPDGYTNIPYRNGFAADGPRYKALGNSMATNVMAWIGGRLNAHMDRVARQQDAA